MNVAIIDDEPPAIALLTAYIQRTKFLCLESAFTDPMDALGHYNCKTPPQLTFLDIDMPGISGIDLARVIAPRTKIILTTSFRDYGPEAFDLSVSDYLLKPFSFERFLEAVGRASSGPAPEYQVPDFFFVRTASRGKYFQLAVKDIIFVESRDNFVYISGPAGITVAAHKLSDIQSWLPARQFCRVHHSYLVSLAEVHAVDQGQVHMKNGSIIPIGRKFREQFINDLQKLLVKGRP